MLELERTFLAKFLPSGLEKCKCKEIIDIYLPTNAHHPKLRIRKNGDKYEITKKVPAEGGDLSQMCEETTTLTSEEFDELSSTLIGKRVHKLRYYYPYGSLIAEVDVFQAQLKGLVVIDFEFKSEEEKNAFQIPDFCLAEVTSEEFIAGGMLRDAVREKVWRY
ncbi:hypothetical protein HZC30_07255 [Candidatus Woesearchaeota archaeon]|nr:hypothetical protein [Candidatus Woesearchaeota archaeon]